MKKLIISALVALTFVLGGCATSGGDLAGRVDSAFPNGGEYSSD